MIRRGAAGAVSSAVAAGAGADLSAPLTRRRGLGAGCGLSGRAQPVVLRPGDRVHVRRRRAPGGRVWPGRSVRLPVGRRSRVGGAGLASAGRARLRRASAEHRFRGWTPFGLLDGLPCRVLAEAREWETARRGGRRPGLPPDAEPGTRPRPEYDPARTDAGGAGQAKADELAGVSARTVACRRGALRAAGSVGAGGPAGGAGVGGHRPGRRAAGGRRSREAMDAETNASTGTRSRLIRRVVKSLAADLRAGRGPAAGEDHLLPADRARCRRGGTPSASATTRRQTANRPDGPFSPTLRRPAG